MILREVKSVCRVCDRNINGCLIEEEGKVYLEKSCPDHGRSRDLVSHDAELFKSKGDFLPKEPKVQCSVEKCLSGLCREHEDEATSIAFLDITSRCNLRCPVCFVDADSRGEDVPIEHLTKIIDYLAAQKDKLYCLLIIGGEPTVHGDFFSLARKIREAGLHHKTYIVTNGVNLADDDFCRRLRDTGIRRIGLSFDGTEEGIYLETKGSAVAFHKSRQALDNWGRLSRTQAVLIATIFKGLNDHNVPDIVRYALDNSDIVKRVLFSMGSFCGREAEMEDVARKRMTADGLEEILREVTGSDVCTFPGSFFHKLNRPWELLGFPNFIKSYPKLYCNQCDTFGLIGRTGDGAIFSIMDRILKHPWRIYRDMEYFELLADRIEKSGKRRGGRGKLRRKLWTCAALAYYAPQYFLKIALMLNPALLSMATRSLLISIFKGGLKRRLKEGVLGVRSVKLWVLPMADKHNLVWDKIRTCTGHYLTYDSVAGRVIKYPSCFYFPFNYRLQKASAIEKVAVRT